MITIAVYSNDSRFFGGFAKKLAGEIRAAVPSFCRFRSFPLSQTSLFTDMDKPPALCIVDLRDDPERSLEFAASLRRETSAEVMAVAASPAYAMAAYNADILSYLLDPPDASRAAKLILRRFFQGFQAKGTQFSFRTASGVQVLSSERIVYVEYSNHRLIIHTDMGESLMTNTMRQSFSQAAAQLLETGRFVRTHASFIVNAQHVSEFGRSALLTDIGVAVPISHARRNEVKEHFNRLFNA